MYISLGRILVLVALISFYACLQGYFYLSALGRIITKKTGRKIPFKLFYWPLAFLAAGLYFFSRYSSGGLRHVFGFVSSYWGLMLFIPFFIAADILIIWNFFSRKTKRPPRGPSAFNPRTRMAALVLAFLTIAAGSFWAQNAKVVNYSVTIEKPLPEKGLRLILISDTHIGGMVRKKEIVRLVSQINALDGDIVLIAGDIIDRNLDTYKNENLNEELIGIRAAMGVFAAPGNHDYFGGNIHELKEQLAVAGINLLIDEAAPLDGVYVIGRNDYLSGRWGMRRLPLGELTAGLDPSLPIIVIDHQPVNLGEAEAAGIDLQVSGHTHGGQIWPIHLVTRRFFENAYGLFYKGKTAVVVTSGYGTWGPPLRMGTRAEIVRIELKSSVVSEP